MRISIDPGLGVRGDGKGTAEHPPQFDYSLFVAKRIYDLLQKETDLVPSLTRWQSESKNWRERLAAVKSHQAQMCLCLNIDSWLTCDCSSFTSYVSVMAPGDTRRLQALLHNDVACRLRLEYGVIDGGKRNDTEHRDFGLPLLEYSSCCAVCLEAIFVYSNGSTILDSDAFQDSLARIIANGIINHRNFFHHHE
ncbi:N-acetylmuramoyl-L-alanine amidase [Desmospora activa DSM 45169]|uniref:N-acetylmuramoyl-L-alanine amidase n=1 Tax=Desmospora activa DSM 45169 TaxID=1121389 RepID=A0A2T4ZD54_9BACL|nr:N-acetylmuramoyl-L-alanine amidase [Desmospora activa DSM 45169]